MHSLKREFPNPKFGLPGEGPRVIRHAATLNDLIASLIKIRDTHGNLPVVRTAFVEDLGGLESEILQSGDTLFSVLESDTPSVQDALMLWDYQGSVLEVRSDS